MGGLREDYSPDLASRPITKWDDCKQDDQVSQAGSAIGDINFLRVWTRREISQIPLQSTVTEVPCGYNLIAPSVRRFEASSGSCQTLLGLVRLSTSFVLSPDDNE